jgi:hypothetical protein
MDRLLLVGRTSGGGNAEIFWVKYGEIIGEYGNHPEIIWKSYGNSMKMSEIMK